ncbi:MAG: hypothetical protein SGI77_10560 [Pirellulaceae bacterium]|nr:hypothetical protein [Pirellulaceae bacterium]
MNRKCLFGVLSVATSLTFSKQGVGQDLLTKETPTQQSSPLIEATSNHPLTPKVQLAPAREQFEDIATRYKAGTASSPFKLRQDYPSSYYVDEQFPWQDVDFRLHPKAYCDAVLRYCFEGSTEPAVDFVVQKNVVRDWYHAPWFHDDGVSNGAGREAHHGLTRERRSRPGEIHKLQIEYAQNWAVGFYNDRGGYTLGKVWPSADLPPNPSCANFPDQTVAFKLLFTDADVAQVPFLKESKEWTANIYPPIPKGENYAQERVDRTVRLLQLDFAVKDPRVANQSGWIFGTFIYDGSLPSRSPLDRLVYIGLIWDDDADNFSRLCSGAFDNPELHGTVLNTSILGESKVEGKAAMLHSGLGGRLNGPVDNPISSCISCHARAAVSATTSPDPFERGQLMAFFDATVRSPTDFSRSSFDRFFKAIRPGPHLVGDAGQTYITTDYSQQLAVGIRNYYQNELLNSARAAAANATEGIPRSMPSRTLPLGTRGLDD